MLALRHDDNDDVCEMSYSGQMLSMISKFILLHVIIDVC